MNDGTSCKTATKLLLGVAMVLALALSLPLYIFAEEIPLKLSSRDDVLPDDYSHYMNVSLVETTGYDYVINPFIPGDYWIDGTLYRDYTPITETYDNYCVIVGNSRNVEANGSFLCSAVLPAQGGAINTVAFEFCIPSTSIYSDSITESSFALQFTGTDNIIYPDNVTIIASKPMLNSEVNGAPVVDMYTQAFKVMLYYEQPVQLSKNAIFTFLFPLHAIEFAESYKFDVGIAWAYNDIIIDYYATLDEAQNAHIINSLDKFPNKHKYDEAIDKNGQLADEFNSVGNYEQSLYDNFSTPDGLPDDVNTDVSLLFNNVTFLWDIPLISTLISVAVALAVLSYALYGGS